ncbi:putative PurR-regulated permease PerM [Glaciihabitans tibetensis]|uniref:Putative PurR-regulated permease PerM n=1 Tax=Glaciihabitans tibetensis TaxID=1266600 RepID=A0A2T0VK27_9MICO|nr:putative PurR-regulated permease PerM [Glaciihabitans tibetensis]
MLLTDRIGWLGLRSGQILLTIGLATALVFAIVQLKLVMIPVMIALIVAAAAAPVMRLLKRRLSALLATTITLLGGVVIFGGIITLIVFAVQDQYKELVSSATDGLGQFQEFLTNGPLPVDQAMIDDGFTAIGDFVTSSQFGSGAIAGVSVAGELITGALLAIVILFFFLKDGPEIWEFFLSPLRGERLDRGRRIGVTAVRVLGGYVRGTATIAFVDAAAIGIGLLVLQVPLALPLAVLVFLGAFIPIVGATATGILAALVALVANGWVVALIVLAIVVLVNQLEGNFLQPTVMANSLKLHPLVILVALTAGTILAGIVGAVLAVPIAAVAWAIAKVWNPPAGAQPVVTGGSAPRGAKAKRGQARTQR